METRKSSEIAELIQTAKNGRGRSDYEAAAGLARRRWNNIQHPLGGLGVLEDDIVQIAGLTGSADISLDKKAVIVFCSDNGVTAEGIAQTDSSVTGVVARRMAEGKTSVCKMSIRAGADVIPVDMGIKDFAGYAGVLDRRIANGTGNILRERAMTPDQAASAISTGIDLARELKQRGCRLLAAGEMGIGNTTTSSACVCVLLGQEPETMTGKGAGLTDDGLKHKIDVVRGSIKNNGLEWKSCQNVECSGVTTSAPELSRQNSEPGTAYDAIEILSRVGGFDLLGMCGLYIGGWMHQIPVLTDGFASSVAALAAVRICPECADAIIASHVSSEPAAGIVLEALGKKPLITGNLHLGEGTGAVLAMPMLDMALAVYRDSVMFGEGGVEQYREL